MPSPIAEAFVRVRPDTTGFRLETSKTVRGALTGLGSSVAVSPLGFGLAGTAALAFTLAAKGAVGGAANLEQQLNVLEVTAGATASEMEAISKEARDLGADLTLPAVSATDATTAMLELSKGGLDVQDTLGGARGVLQLASAAALDVGEAAGIAAQALSTFRLPGEQATRVADLLTGAAQSATGEVTDMAQALAQAGAVAANANIPIEDTVTAITLLAKNGLIGSDAGTSLRTTILKLVPSTKEAAAEVKRLGITVSDSTGTLLPLGDIFDQYRQSLEQLTPIQQQQALTTIFGTDAIRAAAILSREGAAGFDAMKTSVTEVGIAEKVTAARSEGLKGSFDGLKSNAETLGTTLGGLATGPLTGLVTVLSKVAGAANTAAGAVADIGKEPIAPETNFEGNLFGFQELEFQRKSARDSLSLDAKAAVDVAAQSFGAVSVLTHGLAANAKEAGKKLGKALADGVISSEQEAVNAARQTLAEVIQEGNRAVAEAIKQGNEAVRLSAISARQNLISIGSELAGQAVQLIDEGPLAQRIAELRASLGDSQQGNQKQRLRDALSDAQREFEQAQGSIVTGPGPLTKAGQQAVDEFIKPFERKVRDAKAALEEFDTEGVISDLERQAEEQKKTVQKGLADLIVQFNQGTIDLQQLNLRTASLLKANGVSPYGAAGKALGVAFRENFEAELAGLRKQALEIARGLNVPESGLEPNVVSPGQERADQNANIASTSRTAAQRTQDARDALVRAQNALKRANEDTTTALDNNTAALKIVAARLPVPVKSRSGTDLKSAIPEGKR